MPEPFCPECRYRLKMGTHPRPGQRIVCPQCKSSLVLISIDPPELELAPLVDQPARVQKKHNLQESPCPECDHLIKLSAKVALGQQIICSGCETALEIVDTDPLELDYATLTNIKWGRQGKVNRQQYVERKSDRSSKKRK